MKRRDRKSRSKRGSRTMGWGKVGQHRDRGSQSGRQIGMGKTQMVLGGEVCPNWYGKHGFRNPTSVKVSAITLKDLQAGIDSGRFVFKEEGGKKVLDLTQYGVEKLISGGDFYTSEIVVKVNAVTEKAKEKLEKVGAEVILNSTQ